MSKRGPGPLQYVYEWYTELAQARRYQVSPAGQVVPDPITYHDIRAWQEVTATKTTAYEAFLLIRLDGIFRKAHLSKGS